MPQVFADMIASIVILVVMLMLLTAMINLFIRVPFVPSKMRVVQKMVTLAKLKRGEKVYDLGCGDGRLLLEAEKKANIKAEGYEAAPIPYLLAHLQKWWHGSKMNIHLKNFFHINLHDADVIFCYLGPETMSALRTKFMRECKKGTRIFSNTFKMEGMEPTKVWPKNKKTRLPSIYLYQI